MPPASPASHGNPITPKNSGAWLPHLCFRAEPFLEFNEWMNEALVKLERQYPERVSRQRWSGPSRRPK